MDELPGPSQSTNNELELSPQHSGRELDNLSSGSNLVDLFVQSPDFEKLADSRIGPLRNKKGKLLCQICFGLDEAAFKDQANYSMQWSWFIEDSKPTAKQKCKTCSLLRSSISQFEPLWVENPSEIPRSQVLSQGNGRTVPERVNVSATAEDGMIVSFRSLKLELYRRSGTLYPIREHIRAYLLLRALVTARTLLPKKSKLNIHFSRTDSCRFLKPMENIEADSQLKPVEDDSREVSRSSRFTIQCHI